MGWYVYKHTSPSGKIYVGITKQEPTKRWKGGSGYLKNKERPFFFGRAILKYGWDNIKHEIILSNISKSEAIYTEKYLIKWYKTHNMSYNITDGGEGCCGFTLSKEAKEKIRKCKLNTKEDPEKTIARINRRIDNYKYIVIAIKDNNILQFRTAKEAAESLHINTRCNISAAIAGKQCLVNGYVFIHWPKEQKINKDIIFNIVNTKFKNRYKK